MWYWLDGLVNSDLIHPDVLAAVRVAGFLLGILISYVVFPRGPRRFAWVLLVFIGALCTKALILLFEYLQFFTWETMQSSPYFLPFTLAFASLAASLIAWLVIRTRKRYKRRG
jgi:uncharacterized membrane protein